MIKRSHGYVNKIVTCSTVLTCMRIILVPFIIHAIINQAWGYAILFFCCAGITDFLDGALARWFNEQTLVGACLDPLADKLLVTSTYYTLAITEGVPEVIPWWFVYGIVSKELLQIIGVIGFLSFKRAPVIQATLLAKITTVVQLLAIGAIFCCYFIGNIGIPLICFSALCCIMLALAVLCFVQYMCIGYKML